KLPLSDTSTIDVEGLQEKCFSALSDDLNSPVAIAHLFDGVRLINSVKAGQEKISSPDREKLKLMFHNVVFDVLGLQKEEAGTTQNEGLLNGVIDLALNLRLDAKNRKDWATADKIRDELKQLGV